MLVLLYVRLLLLKHGLRLRASSQTHYRMFDLLGSSAPRWRRKKMSLLSSSLTLCSSVNFLCTACLTYSAHNLLRVRPLFFGKNFLYIMFDLLKPIICLIEWRNCNRAPKFSSSWRLNLKVLLLYCFYNIIEFKVDTTKVSTWDWISLGVRWWWLFLVYPVAILDATFVVWIFISLAKTIGKLQVSKTFSLYPLLVPIQDQYCYTLYFVIASFFSHALTYVI